MDIKIKPGKYVAAVSGGVDSVVLLDLLASILPQNNLTVAHFDHGIRKTSTGDREFVQHLAQQYGLKFFYHEGKLGSGTSEETARKKRYEFLNKIIVETDSDAIATAHHQDDVIETAVINILRGTGRKGLSSLGNRPGIIRPLLNFSKDQLIHYAEQKGLAWREDETNLDQKYLRNYVRHNVLKDLSQAHKQDLIKIVKDSHVRNEQIDGLIKDLFLSGGGISRRLFASLDHKVAAEIVAAWLRNEGARLDKNTVERLVVNLKVAPEGKDIQINKNKYFTIENNIIRMNTSGAV